MPKITQNQIAVKIPLAQIVETGNVRTDYDAEYIEQLANSILNNGLLQPIVVKRGKVDENGLQQYELIAGHCRKRAFELLCEKGNDYTSIDACIKTGDKRVIQLIENIQRSELTAADKENALKEMVAAGYSQKQIADELSKPISWVSDILAGNKVRQIVESAGVDTTNIATKTLSQIRSIPKDDLPAVVENIREKGGTLKVATEVLNEYRNKMPDQMPQNGLVKKKMQIKKDKTAAKINESVGDDFIDADFELKIKDKPEKENRVQEIFEISAESLDYLEKVSDKFFYSGLGRAIDHLVQFAQRKNMLKE